MRDSSDPRQTPTESDGEVSSASTGENALFSDIGADFFSADIAQETAKKKRRSNLSLVLISALITLLVLAVTTAGVGWYFVNHTMTAMKSIGNPFVGITDRPAASTGKDAPLNVLIMGSDSRISAGDPQQWEYGAQRTDALMLLQISGDHQHISVMSIPRDSWVAIPGHGHAKINAAFSYGGPTLTIQTVEKLTGVRIDHMAIVDFTSFVELTDVVGGVTLETAEGKQTMNGEEALAFVRERHSLPRGDFDRVRRQQLWMKAVMNQLFSKETLGSPSKINHVVETLSAYVAVDDEFSTSDVLTIASSLRGLHANNIVMFTAPYAGTGTSADGQSIVTLDTEKLAAVSQAFKDDDVADFLAKNGTMVETLTSRPVN